MAMRIRGLDRAAATWVLNPSGLRRRRSLFLKLNRAERAIVSAADQQRDRVTGD